jgi:hypothetical protein
MLTIALAIAACRSGTPRDSDCEQVHAAARGAPRRYRGAIIADKLATTTLRDADVEAAVRAGDLAKLESLCGLVTGTRADARKEDCRLVAMWVPTAEDEANGVGIFDPTVPTAQFRDPQIRAAMKELAESGWMPGLARAAPDPRLAKLRELCDYPSR